MAPLPPNLRVNTQLPFPSLVTATGPITISKVNGVWKIGFSPGLLAPQVPPALNYPTDYVVVYDSVSSASFLVSLSNLPSSPKVQRSIATSADLPIGTTDQILNVKTTSGGFVIPVPLAGLRAGGPLTFKFVSGGSAFTLSRTAPDTFDGVSSLVVNGGTVTLTPYNDGINNSAGYAV